MKKVLNILSYTLNVIFILFFAYSNIINKNSESESDKMQGIVESVMTNERAELPLTAQQYDHVYAITIDDMVVTNNVEPYSAYLVTTWDMDEKQNLSRSEWAANGHKDKYIRKEKTVYVEVSDITTDKNGTISWRTNWGGAYINVMDND